MTVDEGGKRTANVPLDFLEPGKTYTAAMYTDAPDAHWEKNPMAYRVEQRRVTRSDVLTLKLAPVGGAAVSLLSARPAGSESPRRAPKK